MQLEGRPLTTDVVLSMLLSDSSSMTLIWKVSPCDVLISRTKWTELIRCEAYHVSRDERAWENASSGHGTGVRVVSKGYYGNKTFKTYSRV